MTLKGFSRGGCCHRAAVVSAHDIAESVELTERGGKKFTSPTAPTITETAKTSTAPAVKAKSADMSFCTSTIPSLCVLVLRQGSRACREMSPEVSAPAAV